jgi:hypothetical protein
VILCALALLSANLAAPIDPDLARRYFQEIKWISDDDGGALWGRPINGPLLFVDNATRQMVANEPPPAPGFEVKDGVHIGRLPDEFTIANTAFDWKGQRWSMVMWPPPTNRAERASLLTHELFHRIQPELGLNGGSPQNAHLESTQGRVWLQLEMAALNEALSATTNEIRNAKATDALAFRAMRQRQFPGSKTEEDQLELNEGLAEFTGYMLRGGWEPESRLWMANQLRAAQGQDTYARRFAYTTGPAYAFLINVTEAVRFDEIRWRKNMSADFSLAGHLAGLLNARTDLTNDQIEAMAKPYGYKELLDSETQREAARLARIADIRKRYIDGPTLLLPFQKMRISFNPQNVVPLGTEGTYYPTATIIDEWGTIEVTDGILVAGDFRSARVIAPPSAGESNPGWKITLKSGWKIAEGNRKGDFTIASSG